MSTGWVEYSDRERNKERQYVREAFLIAGVFDEEWRSRIGKGTRIGKGKGWVLWGSMVGYEKREGDGRRRRGARTAKGVRIEKAKEGVRWG